MRTSATENPLLTAGYGETSAIRIDGSIDVLGDGESLAGQNGAAFKKNVSVCVQSGVTLDILNTPKIFKPLERGDDQLHYLDAGLRQEISRDALLPDGLGGGKYHAGRWRLNAAHRHGDSDREGRGMRASQSRQRLFCPPPLTMCCESLGSVIMTLSDIIYGTEE